MKSPTATDWFTQHAPLTGLCAAVMKAKPSLRLNMTACEPTTNAQALTNAKLVFAAALENRDAERFGFETWEDGMADGSILRPTGRSCKTRREL